MNNTNVLRLLGASGHKAKSHFLISHFLKILIFLIMGITAVSNSAYALAYSGGDGSLATPYEIANAEGLRYLAETPADWTGLYFILTADIDLLDSATWNVGDHDVDGGITPAEAMGFSPIGTNSIPFTGHFDGNGHQILNMYINRPATDYVGLFGVLGAGAEVKSVGLQQATVTGKDYTGSLAGSIVGGAQVAVCSVVNADVSGGVNVGGLAGGNAGASVVSNCYVTAYVAGDEHAGGMIGLNSGVGTTLMKSYSQAVVTSGNYAGALVARNTFGSVSGCVYDETLAASVAGIGIDDSSEITFNLSTEAFASTDFASTYGWSFGSSFSSPWADGSNDIRPYFYNQPVVTSIRMDTYSTDSATLFGLIPSGSVHTVTAYGITWSANADFSDATTNEASNLEGDVFSVSIAGMSATSTYYYQAYVVDDAGHTFYGARESFSKGLYSGGDGSQGNPFRISDASDLRYLSEHGNDAELNHWALVKYFIQTADIDLADSVNWNSGDHDNNSGTPDTPMGFSPIGSLAAHFKGKYDGGRYKISNLYINRPNANQIGLFGYINGAVGLENIDLVDGSIKGRSYTGMLAGYASSATLRNCSVSGRVEALYSANYVGGLVGQALYSTHAYNCSSSVDVTNLTGGSNTGGLFGESRANLTDCYASGTVKGGNYTGGLVGYYHYYRWDRCYFSGSVTGAQYTGGLIGRVYSNATLNDCFMSGRVSGTSDSGALIGYNLATMNRVYWDRDTAGTGIPFGIDEKNQVVSYLTTSNAVQQSAYVDWSFGASIWSIQDGLTRPYLSQQRMTVMNSIPQLHLDAENWVTLGAGYVYHIGDGDAETLETITEYGYLWKKDDVPTLLDGTKAGGNASAEITEGNGVVLDAVTLVEADGLELNADYYARTYAVDSEGNVMYGDTVFFRTEITGPVLVAQPVSNITLTDATTGSLDLSGFLDLPGNLFGEQISEYGFIYSESAFDTSAEGFDPAAVGQTVLSSTNLLTGDIFTLTAEGLSRNTTYYYVIYAINASGITSYGPVTTAGIYYGGGDGSEATPFILETADHLRFLSEHGNDADIAHWAGNNNFDLQADIDLSDSINWNVGNHDNDAGTPDEAMGFFPIGTSSSPFRGNFAGNGHTISGLYINRPVLNYVGFFGNGARYGESSRTVKDLTLKNCNITGHSYVGGLVGSIYDVDVFRCHTSGHITGNGTYVGGLIGMNSTYSDINNCGSSANVANAGNDTGGLIGRISWYVRDSYASGSVTSSGNNTGGLAGYFQHYYIYRCYASGAVQGAMYTGGLIGYTYNGRIYDSYSCGFISGGDVSGGLIGWCNSELFDCYWDTKISGYSYAMGENQKSQTATGYETDELVVQSNYSGFPFGTSSTQWRMQDGLSRPYLSQQSVAVMNRRAKVYLQDERWVVFDPAYVYLTDDANGSTERTVVEYGFLYKKDGVPTVLDGTKVGENLSADLAEGNGVEIPEVTLIEADGLVRNAIYFMRAYALDSDGMAYYGDTVMFNTEALPPAITTQDASQRTIVESEGSVQFNGLVNSIGSLEDESITEYGFVYGTEVFDPTTEGFDPVATGLTVVASNVALTNNNFMLNVSGLTATQTYYYAAHATSSSGLQGFGNVKTLVFNYGGGDGTEDVPFRLSSAADLRFLSEHGNDIGIKHWDSGKYFELTTNIDLSDSANWNIGDHDNNTGTDDKAMGFLPIGNNSTRFYGTLNGNGYTISGLYINRPVLDYVGFISYGYRYGSSTKPITDLNLENVNITGRSYVGALGGYMYDVDTYRCRVSGRVKGNGSYIGGLMGFNRYSETYDCSSSVNVENTGADTGGLFGRLEAHVYDSHASGSVISTGDRTGGFAGVHYNYSIYRCFASGAVFGTNYTGGFIGSSNSGNIYDCYSTGYVSGNNFTAGLMGYCSASVYDCFWDRSTSGWNVGIAEASAGQLPTAIDYVDAVKQTTYSGFPFNASDWNIFNTISRPYQEIQEVAVMNGPMTTLGEGTVYMNRAGVCVPDDNDSSTDRTVVEYGVMYLEDAVPSEGGLGVVKVVQETNTLAEGEFSDIAARELTGLTEGVPHYLRAYAITGEGRVYYGDTVTFVPELVAPVVETLESMVVTPSYVQVPGRILSKGSDAEGVTITQYGFIYSQTPFTNPAELVNPSTNAKDGEQSGDYFIDFNDVIQYQTYYYAAFAKNSSGAIGYGVVKQFTPQFYSGGSGTEADPFQVANSRDLTFLSQNAPIYAPEHWDSGTYLEQSADIDLSDSATRNIGDHDGDLGTADEAMGFAPIGPSASDPFSANYNGAGNKILGLMINRPVNENPVGMFGYLSGAQVRNVTLVQASIIGNEEVGGVAGVSADSSFILNSGVGGSVSGVGQVGGIVGMNTNSTLQNLYSSAIVVGVDETGGIAGRNDAGTMVNAYTKGYVSGDKAGGLVGANVNAASLVTSYASGITTGTTWTGTLIGTNSSNSTVLNAYWDSETSNSETPFGFDGNEQTAQTLTSALATSSSSFTGFGFGSSDSSPWAIRAGASKPFFYWQDLVVANGASTLIDYNRSESRIYCYNQNQLSDIIMNAYGYLVKAGGPPSVTALNPVIASDGMISSAVTGLNLGENGGNFYTLNSDELTSETVYYARAYAIGSDGMVYYGDLNTFETEPEESVTLTASAGSLSEYNGSLELVATVSGTLKYDVTINLAYSGDALRNTDFSAPSSMVISAGELSATGTVSGIDNRVDAADKSLVVDVDTVVFAIESGTQQLNLILTDDDVTPTLSLNSLSAEYTGSSLAPTPVTDPAELNVVFSIDGSSSAPTNVGTYTITATVDEVGYAAVELSETFTITPRPITLAAVAASKYSGEDDPSFSVSVAAGTLGTGDSLAELTGTITRQAGESEGVSYDLILGTGSKAGNYTITFEADNNAFTIQTPPAISQTGPLAVTMSEDGSPTAWVAPTVSATKTNAVWSATAASHGSVIVSGSGSAPTTFSYVPTANYNGSDSFDVVLNSGAVNEDSITVNVTIDPVNDAPEIVAPELPEGSDPWTQVTMSEDGDPTAFSLTANAQDVDGDVITWSIQTQGAHGLVSLIEPFDRDEMNVDYAPEANWHGTDTFVLKVQDPSGASNTVEITVIVESVEIEQVLSVTPDNGPYSGGNTITITTDPSIGGGSNITSATVCGVTATIVAQGTNSLTLTLGEGVEEGALGDIVIESDTVGRTIFEEAYTYNPAGVISGTGEGESGVIPTNGAWSGGYQVVITGTNLCNGSLSDVSNVTISGVDVTSIDSVSSSTQIVVTVASGEPGVGDVVVTSTDYGITTRAGAFTYEKTDQTISFTSIDDQLTTDTVALEATATSTLDVSFVVISGPAVLTESSLSFTNSGTVVVAANQGGNTNWNPAVSVTNTFAVTKAEASITLGALNPIYSGSAKAVSVVTDPAEQNVVVTYEGSGVAPTNAGSYTVIATIVEPMYQGSATGTLVIAKAGQTIDLTNPGTQKTTDTVALEATSTSGGEVTFAVISGPAILLEGSLSFTNSGSVVISADQTGNDNWNAAPQTNVSFSVTKTVADVTLDDLNPTYDGSAKQVSVMTDPAEQNVVVTYEGSGAAPTNAGSYTVIATIVEPMYQGSATGTLVIAKADQTISFDAIGRQAWTNTVELIASAESELSVSFSIASGPAAFNDGNTVSFESAGRVQLVAGQSGNENWNAATGVTNAFVVYGTLTEVLPDSGTIFGGTEVVISGQWLGDGSDVTNVTLCGVAATVVSQDVHSVTISTGITNSPVEILGDVMVESVGFGAITLSNAFTYRPVSLPPEALSAVDVTSDGFTARWTATENTTHYYVDVATDTNFVMIAAGYTNWNAGDSLSGSIIGLTNGVSYYYRVRAANEYGSSHNSNLIEVPVSDNTPYVQVEYTNSVVSAGSADVIDLTKVFHGTGLIYAVVTNSNPELISDSLEGSELVLVYADSAGSSFIRVQAMDPENGFTVDVVFNITVELSPMLELGPVTLNYQNGLYEQVATVSNRSVRAAKAVTLTVTSLLPSTTVLYNATGTDGKGYSEIHWIGTLAGTESMQFTLQYYSPTGAEPTADVVASLSLEAEHEAVEGEGVQLIGGSHYVEGKMQFMLEFTATPGKLCYIQYTSDLTSEWKTVQPGIIAPVSRMQWIDSGPPATESSPDTTDTRLYRVIEVTP